jgi:hypothetical protein
MLVEYHDGYGICRMSKQLIGRGCMFETRSMAKNGAALDLIVVQLLTAHTTASSA